MLTLPEEYLLLTLSDDAASFLPMERLAFSSAMAGAVLMELAFRSRIDSDPEGMFLVSAEPTGEPVLDTALELIQTEGAEKRSIEDWLQRLRVASDALRECAIERLCARGILEKTEERVAWVFKVRRYPIIDGRNVREAKLRIATILLGDEIPDPQDAALISLADASGLLPKIFAAGEIAAMEKRIEQIAKLDLIGQGTRRAIDNIKSAVVAASLVPY